MTKYLVIYDNNGTVWGQYYGQTSVPSGLQGMVVDVPQNYIVKKINMQTMQAEFEYAPPQTVTIKEVENIQAALVELDARVSALEG